VDRIKLVCSVVFTLLIVKVAFSQEKQINPDYLDSLLIAGDFKTFIVSWEEFSQNFAVRGIPSEEAEDYDTLTQRLRQLPIANAGRLQELSGIFEASYLDLITCPRGEKASLECQKFVDAAANQQYFVALEDFYAALCFMNKYVQSGKKRLRDDYAMAEELYLGGKYDEALRLIETFEDESPSNPAFVILKDSLSFPYSELRRKIETKKAELEFVSENNYDRKNFTLSVDLDMTAYQKPADDPGMILRYKGSPSPSNYDIYLRDLPVGIEGSFDLQAEYNLSRSLSFGARCAIGTIQNADLETLEGTVHLSEKFYSAGIVGTYFPAWSSFVKPYFRLESGVIQVVRGEMQLDPSSAWYSEYFPVSEITKTYPEILGEIGGEYQIKGSNLFCFGAHLLVSDVFGNTSLIEHFSFGGGIQVGVNLF